MAEINGITTGKWLEEFIKENEGRVSSIEEFAEKLKDMVNKDIGDISNADMSDRDTSDSTGFHIAGYSNINGKKCSVFHHINNKLIDSFWDKNPRDHFEDDGRSDPDYFVPGKMIHNGHYLIFRRFLEHSKPLLESITKTTFDVILEYKERMDMNIKTPFTVDLTGYKNVLLTFLRIIHHMYETFAEVNPELPPVVSGEISYILISEHGIEKYDNRGLNVDGDFYKT